MFEYVNPGFLLMSGLMFFTLLAIVIKEVANNYAKGTHKRGGRIFITVLTIITLAFLFWDARDTKNSIINNKADFNKGLPLECRAGLNTYLAQNSRGWQLSKESFTKDDLLILVKNCKTRE